MSEQETTPPEKAPFELILLSPFTYPTHNAMYLGEEDVTCFLHGSVSLWHPAALYLGESTPKISSPYDYEQPHPGHLYAVPESPPPMLPENWNELVEQQGAIAFTATEDRASTLSNLVSAIKAYAEKQQLNNPILEKLLQLSFEQVRPFLAIGFGHGHLEAMFEAMDHENLMDFEGIQEDLSRAVLHSVGELQWQPGETEPLQAVGDRLTEAREVLYAASVYVMDLYLLDENRIHEPLPLSQDRNAPLNIITTGAVLEKYQQAHPDQMAKLRDAVQNETVEVCAGSCTENEEPLLPIESQLWNLKRGTALASELLGQDLRSFARKRFYAHPHTPSFLQSVGIERAMLLGFDEHGLPHYHSTVVNWPASDGKQVDALCRMPYAADNPETYYHLTHYLHETMMQDHAATFALIHTKKPAPWYEDWVELSKWSTVLGQWVTLSQYIEEVSAGDYASPATADEFSSDYLSERAQDPDAPEPEPQASEVRIKTFEPSEDCRNYPVSSFAHHARLRRSMDTAWTLAGLHRALAGSDENGSLTALITEVEDRFELNAPLSPNKEEITLAVQSAMQQSAETLAERLMARADLDVPGYLVLNPCSYTRRVALELQNVEEAIPAGGPVKLCQMQETTAKVVVEIPALGFTWFPGRGGTGSSSSKMVLADERCVRNEYFEAEINLKTGGLRGIRDHRTRMNRIGQQMVFNPGSRITVESIETTSTGPAYGEIISRGTLISEQEEILAKFQQTFRAWSGRPVLDMSIDIEPVELPNGYPWHNYYAARFAWGDERMPILRGVGPLGYLTHQMRPESPDYLDLRAGNQSTVILPGGLPFHQRQGARMLDVILIPPGEKTTHFDLAIGIDRDYPLLTSYGILTPVPVVKTERGLSKDRASGWLFHVDSPNLMLTSLRPALDGSHSVTGRFVECLGYAGHVQLRCVKDPIQAELIDARGVTQMEASFENDTILLDVAEGELLHLRIDFS